MNIFEILNLKQPQIRKPGVPLFTFDLLIGPIVIKGCRVMENSKTGALFIALPQHRVKKDGRDKYYRTVEVPETITDMVLREIISGNKNNNPNQYHPGEHSSRANYHPQDGNIEEYQIYQGGIGLDETPF